MQIILAVLTSNVLGKYFAFFQERLLVVIATLAFPPTLYRTWLYGFAPSQCQEHIRSGNARLNHLSQKRLMLMSPVAFP